MSGKASALLCGILVRWRLSDPSVLQDIFPGCHSGFVKDPHLGFDFALFCSQNHEYRFSFSFSEYKLVPYLYYSLYMCRFSLNVHTPCSSLL